jgi:hypothetical protein
MTNWSSIGKPARNLGALCALALGSGASAACEVETGPSAGGSGEIARGSDGLCLVGPAFPSCYGQCGHLTCSPIDPNACCHCDAGCVDRDDCCCDYPQYCLPPPTSCVGHCGGMAPDGCFCDAFCTGLGDCCDDFPAECLAWPKVIPRGSAEPFRGPWVSTDTSGNVYLAAEVRGPWDPGGGSLPLTSSELLLASYDGLGGFRWAKRVTAPSGVASATKIATKGSTTYVAARAYRDLYYDGALVLPYPAGGSSGVAALLAVDNSTGNLRWLRTLAARGQTIWDLAFDASGRPVVTALIEAVHPSPSVGKVASWDSAGNPLYEVTGPTGLPLWTVATTPAGHVYTADSGGGGFAVVTQDLMRILPAPATLIGLRVEGGWIHDMLVGPDGKLYVSGVCQDESQCRVDGSPVPGGSVPRAFLFRSTTSGVVEWIRAYTAGIGIRLERLELDSSSNLVALGWYQNGPASFGGTTLGAPGSSGVFTLAVTRAGTFVSASLVARSSAGSIPIIAGDLAMFQQRPRFVTAGSNFPIVVSGTTYDTTAPSNAILLRLP